MLFELVLAFDVACAFDGAPPPPSFHDALVAYVARCRPWDDAEADVRSYETAYGGLTSVCAGDALDRCARELGAGPCPPGAFLPLPPACHEAERTCVSLPR